MNENNTNIILEILAEAIRRLRVDLIILKNENERLRKENEDLKFQANPLARRANDG